jgi:DNA topoisomerase IA
MVVVSKGLIVLARNYLDVYPYDKWIGKEIPEFREGEEFEPTSCEMKEGQTTSPTLLTEADLVTLMDKNGIGTCHNVSTPFTRISEYWFSTIQVRMQPLPNTSKPSSTENM